MWHMLTQMLFRGRYGFDQLGRVLLVSGLLCELAALWLVAMPLQIAGLALLLIAFARMFSRNTEARRAEARRFQMACLRGRKHWQRLRYNWPRFFNGEYLRERRQYKFLRCPRCNARLRLPRGKGRLMVTCPRCGHKMEGKS